MSATYSLYFTCGRTAHGHPWRQVPYFRSLLWMLGAKGRKGDSLNRPLGAMTLKATALIDSFDARLRWWVRIDMQLHRQRYKALDLKASVRGPCSAKFFARLARLGPGVDSQSKVMVSTHQLYIGPPRQGRGSAVCPDSFGDMLRNPTLRSPRRHRSPHPRRWAGASHHITPHEAALLLPGYTEKRGSGSNVAAFAILVACPRFSVPVFPRSSP